MVLGEFYFTVNVRTLPHSQTFTNHPPSDAFAGGFLAGVVQGKPLDTCVDLGQWLAKLSIKELGPSYPFPKQTYTSS